MAKTKLKHRDISVQIKWVQPCEQSNDNWKRLTEQIQRIAGDSQVLMDKKQG